MLSYEESWPEGFNATLSKEVVTRAVTREILRVGATAVGDVNIIYSRVIGMQQSLDIKLSDVLQCELAPVPASMFAENGEMRIAETKATLKKNPGRNPIENVRDIVVSFTSFIFGKVERSEIYLVFDRYHDFSIKSGT